MVNHIRSTACERNKKPILDVLKKFFHSQSKIIEIASGTGEHAAYFTSQMPDWHWQPSDTDLEAIEIIRYHQNNASQSNFMEPIQLSTTEKSWRIGTFQGAFCANMIHISPWESCEGLFRNLKEHLVDQSYLILYGPFFSHDIETAKSNLEFDSNLRSRNPSWGIRHLENVNMLAKTYGFKNIEMIEMPANNLTIIYQS